MAGFDRNQHITADDLSAYADGEIASADERTRIEQHLAGCEDCRTELESIRMVSALLKDLPEPELPRSFRLTPADIASQEVEPDEDNDPVPIQPWILQYQSAFRYAGLAAALLLAVIVTVDLLPDDRETTDEVAEPETLVTMDQPEQDAAMPEKAPDEAADAPSVLEVDDDAPTTDRTDQPVTDEEVDEPIQDTAPEEEALDEDLPAVEPDADADEDMTGEAFTDEEPTPFAEDAPEHVDQEEPTLTTLRLIAIGLGLLSTALLFTGFVLPRWIRPIRR